MRDLIGLLAAVASARVARVVCGKARVPTTFRPKWRLGARWAVIGEDGCIETPRGLRTIYRPRVVRAWPLVAVFERWQDGGGGDEYIVLAANEVTGADGLGMIERAVEESARL